MPGTQLVHTAQQAHLMGKKACFKEFHEVYEIDPGYIYSGFVEGQILSLQP